MAQQSPLQSLPALSAACPLSLLCGHPKGQRSHSPGAASADGARPAGFTLEPSGPGRFCTHRPNPRQREDTKHASLQLRDLLPTRFCSLRRPRWLAFEQRGFSTGCLPTLTELGAACGFLVTCTPKKAPRPFIQHP